MELCLWIKTGSSIGLPLKAYLSDLSRFSFNLCHRFKFLVFIRRSNLSSYTNSRLSPLPQKQHLADFPYTAPIAIMCSAKTSCSSSCTSKNFGIHWLRHSPL